MRDKRALVSKIAYYSFYLAIIIEVLIVLVDKSNYTNPIEGRLFQLTFLLCVIKVCLTKYSWKEYLTIFLFCILGAISYYVTGRNEIMRLVMLVAACKNIDMKKCLKMIFWMMFVGCMIIVLLSITGIYGAVSLTQDYGRGGVETRYTLGMGHPNALQCMVWALTTLGLYLYAERMKLYQYALVLVMNIGFFLISDSKTSLLVILFAIAMFYLVSRKEGIVAKACSFCGIAVTIFSVLVSVVLAANAYRVYNYFMHEDKNQVAEIFVRINDFLNGRVRMLVGTTGWQGATSSWSLFSNPDNISFFDMGWVRLFYWYGIIPAVVFVLVTMILVFYCYRVKDYSSVILVAVFALYTVVEAHAVSEYLARNYVFFLIGAFWSHMFLLDGEEQYFWKAYRFFGNGRYENGNK